MTGNPKKNYLAFTLAEVLIAKRERGKMSLPNLSRTRDLKAPSGRFLKQSAFTLAEVLITLAIIGVVAAMTIPVLINNYQKTQYVTAMKKAYSGFNQALAQMANDNGCPGDLQCTNIFGTTSTHLTSGDTLVSYFKILSNCKDQNGLGCMSTAVSTNYDGSAARSDYDTSYYKFVTADGVAYKMGDYADNCADKSYSTGATGNMTQACAWLHMDVNGPSKGPNNFGRDIFYFYITNGKGPMLYPAGGKDDNTNGWWLNADGVTPKQCNPSSLYGRHCAGRVIEQGWAMNY